MKALFPRCLALGVTALLVLPGTAMATKSPKDIKMTFEVDNGALVLKTGWLSTTPSNCQKDDHPGCYDISSTEMGSFRLTLKKGDADCEDDESWKWDSVTLGGEGSADSPQPKPEDWGNISADAANDFSADQTTGKVNLTADGKKRVLFEDQNNSEFSVWYKVSVMRCGDGKVLEYDPRIDNRG